MHYNFINPKTLIIQGNKKNKKVKSAMFDAFVIAFPRSFLFPAHSAGQYGGTASPAPVFYRKTITILLNINEQIFK